MNSDTDMILITPTSNEREYSSDFERNRFALDSCLLLSLLNTIHLPYTYQFLCFMVSPVSKFDWEGKGQAPNIFLIARDNVRLKELQMIAYISWKQIVFRKVFNVILKELGNFQIPPSILCWQKKNGFS